jgi:hypothetical protein
MCWSEGDCEILSVTRLESIDITLTTKKSVW